MDDCDNDLCHVNILVRIDVSRNICKTGGGAGIRRRYCWWVFINHSVSLTETNSDNQGCLQKTKSVRVSVRRSGDCSVTTMAIMH